MAQTSKTYKVIAPNGLRRWKWDPHYNVMVVLLQDNIPYGTLLRGKISPFDSNYFEITSGEFAGINVKMIGLEYYGAGNGNAGRISNSVAKIEGSKYGLPIFIAAGTTAAAHYLLKKDWKKSLIFGAIAGIGVFAYKLIK